MHHDPEFSWFLPTSGDLESFGYDGVQRAATLDYLIQVSRAAEAAGFVSDLVEGGGWNTFRDFYSEGPADDGPTLADAVDVNLQRHYGATLAQIEALVSSKVG